MKVVIDHLSGSRRGQRQEFSDPERVQFGRHPRCEVAFDTHRDLDASSRHAEIRRAAEGFLLHDIGSSNGTLVDGRRVDELALPPEESIVVEFGPGGPTLRIWIGAGEPPPIEPLRRPPWRRYLLALAAAVALAIAVILALS